MFLGPSNGSLSKLAARFTHYLKNSVFRSQTARNAPVSAEISLIDLTTPTSAPWHRYGFDNDKLRAALDRAATLIVENVRNLPGLLESVRTCNGNLTDARALAPQVWSHGPEGKSDLRSLWAKPIPLGFVVWRFFEIALFDERSDRATEGGLTHVAGDRMVSHIRGFRYR